MELYLNYTVQKKLKSELKLQIIQDENNLHYVVL